MTLQAIQDHANELERRHATGWRLWIATYGLLWLCAMVALFYGKGGL